MKDDTNEDGSNGNRERERDMMIVIRQLDRYIDRNLRILGGLGGFRRF